MDATAQDVLSGRAAWAVECAEAVEGLRGLPAGCVQCVCTSPPFYGLRSYLPDGHPDKGREIGLEQTPDAYVARLVEVFGEVKRVLRDDGTLWLNLGDSYSGGGGFSPDAPSNCGPDTRRPNGGGRSRLFESGRRQPTPGLKAKDLIGAPWRVAFALQADGWYLRAAITWCKVSPMPESCRDRVTRATEMVFLLATRPTYFYDQEAERAAVAPATVSREPYGRPRSRQNDVGKLNRWGGDTRDGSCQSGDSGRNLWDYWTDIRPSPGDFQHFAAYPPDLPRRCLRLGTSEKGACRACGSPWRRVLERKTMVIARSARAAAMGEFGKTQASGTMVSPSECRTAGWRPSCACPPADPVPCLVLDPFAGSGTTGMVARRLGRRFVGLDLNSEYVALARRRIESDAPLFNAAPPAPPPAPGLFDALTPEAP